MMKKIFILLLLSLLCGCELLSVHSKMEETQTPYVYRRYPDLQKKKYTPLALLSGTYSRHCFFLGAFCFGDTFMYDDLLTQAQKLNAHDVINFTYDRQTSSPFWGIIYWHAKYKANGLAIRYND